VSFTYELASLSNRALAYGVDLLLRIAIVFGVLVLIGVLALGTGIQGTLGLLFIVHFLVEWGYYVLFEWIWDGQSPGKKLFELRVVKVGGQPIGFFDSVLRNFLRAADGLPMIGAFNSPFALPVYGAAVVSVLFTKRFQRLGDLAAGTMVVHEQPTGFISVAPQLETLRGEGELRGIALSNREAQLLQEFVLRKDRLHPERRQQLADILAEPYRQRYIIDGALDSSQVLVHLHNSAAGDRA
jgi:uncharacterized RDD family membrane protein YckC